MHRLLPIVLMILFASLASQVAFTRVVAAKCTKVPCKLDDDLLLTLAAPTDPNAPKTELKVRIALGAHIGRTDAWQPAFEVELIEADLRRGATEADRVVSIASFIGDWSGSPLPDVLRGATGPVIPFTVASVGPDGKPDESRNYFSVDATTLFDANRAPLQLEQAQCEANEPCQFSRTLEIHTPRLYDWLSTTRKDARKLELMLNGRIIPGLEVNPVCDQTPIRQHPCRIDIPLLRHYTVAQNVSAWQAFLTDWRKGAAAVNVALAADGKQVSNTVQTRFSIVPESPSWALIPGLAILLLLIVIARFDNLCRDTTVIELFDGQPPQAIWPSGSRAAFSLGRIQMVFWTIVVIVSFAYIYFAAGEWNSITASTVALLGISAGTAVGARVADVGSKEWGAKALPAVSLLASIDAEIRDLDQKLGGTSAGSPEHAQLTSERAAAVARRASAAVAVADLNASRPAAVHPSRGFFRDLIQGSTSDTALHRLQMVIFTLLYGAIFLINTVTQLGMPEFSATVLALLGISSATYVGFKFT